MKPSMTPVNRILHILRGRNCTPEEIARECAPFLTLKQVFSKLMWLRARDYVEWDGFDGSEVRILWTPWTRKALDRAAAQMVADEASLKSNLKKARRFCRACGQRVKE